MGNPNILGNDPLKKSGPEGKPVQSPGLRLKLLNPLAETKEAPGPREGHRSRETDDLLDNGFVPSPRLKKSRKRLRKAAVRIQNLDEALGKRVRLIEDRIEDSFENLEKGMEEILHRLNVPAPELGTLEENLKKAVENYEQKFESVIGKIETSLPRAQERKAVITKIKTPIEKGQQLLQPSFYRDLWRKFSMLGTGDEVDEFGLDTVFEDRIKPMFDFLYDKWWRVEAEGIANIPDSGRVLLVANHSGTLPFDGAMIKLAVRNYHPTRREVRPLVENFAYYFPFIGNFMAKTGSVRACQENAVRLLEKDEVVIVFPEGIKGPTKYYKERYRLQRFGRGGFVRLALKTHSPIVPIAVVGSEEIYPIIARLDFIGKILGFPIFPITPTFPWLGPLGLVPLPSKWHIRFGTPIRLDENPPESIDDQILINHISEKIRAQIQDMVYELLKKRKSTWRG